jgi:hypothetical protein
MATNDGGPAFPAQPTNIGISGDMTPLAFQPGMSLRDWFAGMAIQGTLSDPCSTFNTVAAMAYKQADAMLAERKRVK